MILGLQALLALAYTLLAHLASARQDDRLGAGALLLLVLMLLLAAMAQRRVWAWLLLPVLCLGVLALYRAGLVTIPILLVPVAFVVLIAWWFGRSLDSPRGPLITRIVAAIEGVTPQQVAPELRAYTRGLTAAWALVLGLLGAINLLLAMIAVPGGLLASLGVQPPLAITREQWSWAANLLSYGIVGGFFAGEYLLRKRRFPGRYRNFADFLRKLAGLGPGFWRDFLR